MASIALIRVAFFVILFHMRTKTKFEERKKEVDREIGKLIREARNKRGLSQVELSIKLGYESPVFVSLIEKGKSPVPLRTIWLLGKEIGLPIGKVKKMLIDSYEKRMHEAIDEGKKWPGISE